MDRDRFIARVAERLRTGDGSHAVTSTGSPAPRDAPPTPTPDALAALFRDRLAELGGSATLVPTRDAAREAVTAIMASRGWSRLACAPGPRWTQIEDCWTSDPRAADLGLSEAEWGIAETGTVVVRHFGERGRSCSLVPAAAGFLLPLSGLRPTMAPVIAALHEQTLTGQLPACVTFISGPSHSGDIGGIFVTGVHGPGDVHVWLIADE